MNLYLVRHGRTKCNVENICMGQGIDPSLCEEGIEDALELKRKMQELDLDVAFSSPMKRACETANIILSERNLEKNILESLKEVSWGIAEGLKQKEIQRKYKTILKDWKVNMNNDASLPKGEMRGNFFARVNDSFKEITKNDFRNVLVVCHSGVISAFFDLFLEQQRLEYGHTDIIAVKYTKEAGYTLFNVF